MLRAKAGIEDPSQAIYSRGMQNLPSQVSIGTGSISAARRVLLMLLVGAPRLYRMTEPLTAAGLKHSLK